MEKREKWDQAPFFVPFFWSGKMTISTAKIIGKGKLAVKEAMLYEKTGTGL
jgi:hypothetical protein